MTHATQLLLHFLVSGVAVLLVAAFMPGMKVKSYFDAIAFAVVVGVLDVIAWEILAPLTKTFVVLTLGVGYFVVNGLVFLGGQKIVKGVEFSGCFVAAIAALFVAVVNSGLAHLLRMH